jgi:adenylate kinase family enzyme
MGLTDPILRTPEDYPIWAITGIPGSGKTTLAHRLAADFGREYVGTGDIARRISPELLAKGELADQEAMKAALLETLRGYGFNSGGPDFSPVVLDGWPRTPQQVGWIPEGAVLIFYLSCSTEIALERLARRGRGDDDAKRVHEQSKMLEGFIRDLVPWTRQINVTHRNPDYLAKTFGLYLRGERREVF